jgi:hypothetical protein
VWVNARYAELSLEAEPRVPRGLLTERSRVSVDRCFSDACGRISNRTQAHCCLHCCFTHCCVQTDRIPTIEHVNILMLHCFLFYTRCLYICALHELLSHFASVLCTLFRRAPRTPQCDNFFWCCRCQRRAPKCTGLTHLQLSNFPMKPLPPHLTIPGRHQDLAPLHLAQCLSKRLHRLCCQGTLWLSLRPPHCPHAFPTMAFS